MKYYALSGKTIDWFWLWPFRRTFIFAPKKKKQMMDFTWEKRVNLRAERLDVRMAQGAYHCDTIESLVLDDRPLYNWALTVHLVLLTHLMDAPLFAAVVVLQKKFVINIKIFGQSLKELEKWSVILVGCFWQRYILCQCAKRKKR